MIHDIGHSGLTVEMAGADETNDGPAADYGVYLRDRRGEIVSWTGDEWIEDPTVVASIVNCILIATTEGPDELRNQLGNGAWDA